MSAARNVLYRSVTTRKLLCLVGLFALLALCFYQNMMTGASSLSVRDLFTALFQAAAATEKIHIIVWTVRLPNALMAILAGAGLAVAGMEMQTILNNSLASPYTLGISSAASFGAALSLVLGYSVLSETLQNYITPIFAFVFALGSSMLVYAVGKIKKDRATIILAGIAMNFLFTGLNSVFSYFVPDETLRGITNWSYGSLVGATLLEDAIVFAVLLVCVPLLLRESWKLTSLSMGEQTAKALGVDVSKLRTKMMILVSVITAVSVCFIGTIGFIGLVAPYIAKRIIGQEQRFYIPAALLVGAILLSAASILSKTPIFGVTFAIALITNMIGIPFLLILILQNKR
ncbi:MAG: iron ABC transporter permease [Peptococcaceae bacterium]|jgi:iron complex transport system permease protein|nr:iron ABC transporter permease [Peptococcaceae bacterium]